MIKITLLAAAAVAAFAPSAFAQSATFNLRAVGLTADNELIAFRTAAPRATSRLIGTIAGTNAADAEIVGIDYRVQDGKLYAVGRGGGVYTIDPATAVEVINELEPSIVIPMHYGRADLNQKEFGGLAQLSAFLKEIGKEDVAAQPKLSITRDKLPAEMQVVVLE